MYEYETKPKKFKNFFMIILLIIIVSAGSILIYKIYFENNVIAEPYKSNQENIVEEVKEKDITDLLEETNKSIVGISKIKNAGSSIFLSNSTKELGLGTGIIVSIYY